MKTILTKPVSNAIIGVNSHIVDWEGQIWNSLKVSGREDSMFIIWEALRTASTATTFDSVHAHYENYIVD